MLATARYQRCALVQSLAQRLGIALLFLPAYSPTLHLSERLWKFVKKQCLSSKYYAAPLSFQQAIIECIAQAPSQQKEALASLLPLQFQSFKAVRVLGERTGSAGHAARRRAAVAASTPQRKKCCSVAALPFHHPYSGVLGANDVTCRTAIGFQHAARIILSRQARTEFQESAQLVVHPLQLLGLVGEMLPQHLPVLAFERGGGVALALVLHCGGV